MLSYYGVGKLSIVLLFGLFCITKWWYIKLWENNQTKEKQIWFNLEKNEIHRLSLRVRFLRSELGRCLPMLLPFPSMVSKLYDGCPFLRAASTYLSYGKVAPWRVYWKCWKESEPYVFVLIDAWNQVSSPLPTVYRHQKVIYGNGQIEIFDFLSVVNLQYLAEVGTWSMCRVTIQLLKWVNQEYVMFTILCQKGFQWTVRIWGLWGQVPPFKCWTFVSLSVFELLWFASQHFAMS